MTFLQNFIDRNDYALDNDSWFSNLKEIAGKCGFAASNKEFKANPSSFVGHVGDAAEILRLSLTGSKNSPNLWAILQVLGQAEVEKRLQYIIEKLH